MIIKLSVIILLIVICGYSLYYIKKSKFSREIVKNFDKIIECKKQEINILGEEIESKLKFIEFQNEQSDSIALKIKNLENQKEQIELSTQIEEQSLNAYRQDVEKHKAAIESAILDITNKYLKIKEELIKEVSAYEQKIKAYIDAEKRKEEMQTKIDFYRLQLTEEEEIDVLKLLNLASSLHYPDVLKKLVYKTYFEKKMNDLLGRVVGANSEIAGIYKITHIESGKSYIGQTVNIKDRWRTHLKRGLGIEAPSSNKFYQSMYELKPWSFTWEVLENCKKEELNEKERYWIDFHQTNTWGWNSKGGNK